MCGIVGFINNHSSSLEDDIITMRDSIPYRGPDGKGHVLLQKYKGAIGHRRLSILDLSDAGRQPMTDTSESYIIVHNGEVYNYVELRRDLKNYGYSFRSETDTEVILAAYDKWGSECLRRFNGMFAFAIWDKNREQLFLARDRLGIKPLYYYLDKDSFFFASEVKSILKVLKSKPQLNSHLIDYYMSFGYVPGENTLFKGIKRLLPGHYLVYNCNNLLIKKYWDFSFRNSTDRGLQYYIAELKSLLNSSIDLRLRSDVPLGIFLSGGIDSSAVVALLAPRVNERLKTFSVAYDCGAEFNETNYARIVAQKFNTDHHEFLVSPAEFRDFIPEYIYHMDEPVTESAAISLYYIAKMARDYVTVVLSGEGSDELFAGYDFYYYNTVIEKLRKFVGNRGILPVITACSSVLPDNKIKKYLDMTLLPLSKRYKGISTYEEKIKKSLYTSEFNYHISNNDNNATKEFLYNLFEKTISNDVLSRMLYFDTKTWLVDDLLIKADRMSMTPSLELRVPFLDHRIVEFASTIPSKYKLSGKNVKFILKKMLHGILPNEIINRKKMGFPTPLKIMFGKDLYDYAVETLLSQKAVERNYFKSDEIKRILDEHRKGIRDNHRMIWQLLVLEEWHRTFIDS